MDALLAKDLIVVTGKGGTGKTTVAGAIGLAAARRGHRVVVVEVAARDDLARTLAGSGSRPFDEREVRPDLHHVSVDPEYAMEEYLIDQLPSKALASVLVRSRMFTYLAAATPGLRELLTMGKVWELAQPERRTPGAAPYDLVVLDAPATGHGLALLDAPRTFADAARVGPIARQGRTIQQMLSDPSRTGVVAVTTPEELPVSETIALRSGLHAGLGLELDAVVINAVLPDRLSAAESEALTGALASASPGSPAHRALSVAGHHHRRRRGQLTQTRRLRRALDGGVPVVTLPFLFTAEIDAADLDTLSERLR